MNKDLQSVKDQLEYAIYKIDEKKDVGLNLSRNGKTYAALEEALTTLDNYIARQSSNGWQDIEKIPKDGKWYFVVDASKGMYSSNPAAYKWDDDIWHDSESENWPNDKSLFLNFTHFKPVTLPSIKSIKE